MSSGNVRRQGPMLPGTPVPSPQRREDGGGAGISRGNPFVGVPMPVRPAPAPQVTPSPGSSAPQMPSGGNGGPRRSSSK